MDIDPAVIKTAAPGIVGSLLAAIRARGQSRAQVLSSIIGGLACSHWGSDIIVQLWPRVSQGGAGFVLGFFGMALLAKLWELVNDIQPAALLRSALEARGWLKPAATPKDPGNTTPHPTP